VSDARLHIRGVKKSFGPTIALGGVSLTVGAGEVHALVGENGAGKSTLMKLLVGAVKPDEGAILLDGAPYAPSGPADATRAGVAMVHQERSLCAHLSVAENVALGVEPARLGVVKQAELRRMVEAALREVTDPSSALSPDAIVRDLSPGDQQLVEIARALARASVGGDQGGAGGGRACRVLILDEPTSSLAKDDVERLFVRIRALRSRGLAILYISHFLEELAAIADRFTVLRDGVTVGTGAMADVTGTEIVTMMAGRAIEQLFVRTPRARGEAILTLDGLSGAHKPTGASLALHRGEVLGLAGLVGAGRTELLRAVFGLDPVKSGTVRVGSVSGIASPAQRLAQGVGMVSEDRKREGLAGRLSIADNLTLSKLPRARNLPAAQEAATRHWAAKLGVRYRDPWQPIDDLSGGNQQKIAIARLLHHGVDVLLLDEPTRGIDVGSKAQIYALVDRLAAEGKAVLFVSSYLPELLGTCDRIAVMRRGRLSEARAVEEWDEHRLLASVTGVA
jgi:ribose transport system ATP-binding protein